MRIISKERDYFDSIQAYGLDSNVIYVRKAEEHDISTLYKGPMFENIRDLTLERSRINQHIHTVIIGFCGKIYPVIHMEYIDQSQNRKTAYCYSSQDIMDTLKIRNEPNWFVKPRYDWHKFTKKDVDRLFDELEGSECLESIFRDYNCPIFTITVGQYCTKRTHYRGAILATNPILLPYDFQRKFDPYTAFQEIAMYISGVLGVDSVKMVQISDKDMRDAKGFNDISFKTRKGAKKPRRRKQ